MVRGPSITFNYIGLQRFKQLIFALGDSKLAQNQPCCKAVYSFHPDQEGELDFDEGDIITLSQQVDANWYEGVLRGRSGLFPISYVDVLVPLPLP